MIISQNEKECFKKYGFVKLNIKLSRKKIYLFKQDIKKLTKFSKLSNSNINFYFEKSLENKLQLFRIEHFYNEKLNISKFIKSGFFEKILKSFTKKKYELLKEKINLKPPGSYEDTLHQDHQTGWLDFGKEIISFVVSIDKSNKNNSSIIFDISGNNSKKKIGKPFKKLKIKDLKKPKFKNHDLESGEIIMFNGFVPHMSKKNLSKKSRKQIYITFVIPKFKNVIKKYYETKLLNYPPNIKRKKNIKYNYKI